LKSSLPADNPAGNPEFTGKDRTGVQQNTRATLTERLALKQCRAESFGADGAEGGGLCRYRRAGQNRQGGLRHGFRRRCAYELRVIFRQNDPGWRPIKADRANRHTTIRIRCKWPTKVEVRMPGQYFSDIAFE